MPLMFIDQTVLPHIGITFLSNPQILIKKNTFSKVSSPHYAERNQCICYTSVLDLYLFTSQPLQIETFEYGSLTIYWIFNDIGPLFDWEVSFRQVMKWLMKYIIKDC